VRPQVSFKEIPNALAARSLNHTGNGAKRCHPDATLASNRMRKLQLPSARKPLIYDHFCNRNFVKKWNFKPICRVDDV
jgi:hypothetical protein